MQDRPHDDSHSLQNLRSPHLFAPEVNGLFLGFLTVEDRNPWDHDLSAGGMSIWLRYLGPADGNACSRERYDPNAFRDSRDSLEHKAVKGSMVGHRTHSTAVVAEQQARCYELRRTGMTLRKIADETGLGFGTVHRRIQAAIAAERQQQQSRSGGESA